MQNALCKMGSRDAAADKLVASAVAGVGLGLVGLWIYPANELMLMPFAAIVPDGLAYVLYFAQFLACGLVFGVGWVRGRLMLGIIAMLALLGISWALGFFLFLRFGHM
jgi:hypothetical protein